jgi:hypothetical protein
MKFCKVCFINQPIENFTSNKQNADNLHTSCKKCLSSYRKIQRSTPSQKEKNKLYAIRSKYNLSSEEYYEIISRGCDSCGSSVGIAIDHDHLCCPATKTCGKCIRGVLCRRCNTAEGIFKTNPQSIYGLIEYMKKHGIL